MNPTTVPYISAKYISVNIQWPIQVTLKNVITLETTYQTKHLQTNQARAFQINKSCMCHFCNDF